MLRRWYCYNLVESGLGALWGRGHWLVALAGVILLSGLASAQIANVSLTIVNGYPLSLLPAFEATRLVQPQSSPSGLPYTVTITPGTGGNWLAATGTSGTTG